MIPINWEDFEKGIDPGDAKPEGEEETVIYPTPDFEALCEALKQCHRMHFGSRGSEVSQ